MSHLQQHLFQLGINGQAAAGDANPVREAHVPPAASEDQRFEARHRKARVQQLQREGGGKQDEERTQSSQEVSKE